MLESNLAFTATSYNNPFKLDYMKPNMTQVSYKTQAVDQTNEYIKVLIDQFRQEISMLKKYIEKINEEIRKNLNIQIPSFSEGFDLSVKNYISGEKASSLDQNVLDEWLNKLINMDYINPLFSLYDTHIDNLNEELVKLKEQVKSYDSKISDLVNENNSLRSELKLRAEEMKKYLEVRINNETDSQIVMDYDYVKKLEERCNLLSKENDILSMNYTNLLKENLDIKYSLNNKFRIYNEKANDYDNLLSKYKNSIKSLQTLKSNLDTTQLKVLEINDRCIQLETQNKNLKEKLGLK